MQDQKAFGNFLRAERELRQIPLAEVAAATKIPLHTLRSLEGGAWDGLPADVFLRGFVRAYAKHIGLPSEEVCRRFDNTLATIFAAQQVQVVEPVGDAAAEVGGRRRMGLALFLIIILIIATITLSLIWRRGASANIHAALDPTATSRSQA